MAVEPAVQGQGIGRELVEALKARFTERRESLWCNARTTAAGFYVGLGFEVVGVPFDVPGIGPHVVMRWAPR
jgi:ribosomal protein S18 acetylase RimI-like enzyme